MAIRTLRALILFGLSSIFYTYVQCFDASTVDAQKCDAGHREWCPPIFRCWDESTEVDCASSPLAYHTLTVQVIDAPPQNINPNEDFFVSWIVDFKNSTFGGQYTHPWISHTNVHTAPSDLGDLSPPSGDPLRKDSVTLTGGAGKYSSNVALPQGSWLVMVHLRIQNMNDTYSHKYDMTVDFVRQIGNATVSRNDTSALPLGSQGETFCKVFGLQIFSDCDQLRLFWIGCCLILSLAIFLTWLQNQIFILRQADGALALKIEASYKMLLQVLLCVFLAAAVIYVNNGFLIRWVATNRTPNRIVTTDVVTPLTFPNMLVCSFLQTGKVQLLSAVVYPNLYGLKVDNLTDVKQKTWSIVDATDGTEITRNCYDFDLAAFHNRTGPVTSIYTTMMLKVIVPDPIRTDTGGWGDTMVILYTGPRDLQDINVVTANMILAGQAKASYISLTRNSFQYITGLIAGSYDYVTSILDNPYQLDTAPACADQPNDACTREVVLVVNFKTLVIEMTQEVVSIDLFTVASLMVGVISGAQMILHVVSGAMENWYREWMRRSIVHYFVGTAPVSPKSFSELPSAEAAAAAEEKAKLHGLYPTRKIAPEGAISPRKDGRQTEEIIGTAPGAASAAGTVVEETLIHVIAEKAKSLFQVIRIFMELRRHRGRSPIVSTSVSQNLETPGIQTPSQPEPQRPNLNNGGQSESEPQAPRPERHLWDLEAGPGSIAAAAATENLGNGDSIASPFRRESANRPSAAAATLPVKMPAWTRREDSDWDDDLYEEKVSRAAARASILPPFSLGSDQQGEGPGLDTHCSVMPKFNSCSRQCVL